MCIDGGSGGVLGSSGGSGGIKGQLMAGLEGDCGGWCGGVLDLWCQLGGGDGGYDRNCGGALSLGR